VLSGEKLPPVLPIVLYNGAPHWNAPVEVSELIAHVASPSPEKMKEIVIALMEWLNFPEQQHLVRAFIVWFSWEQPIITTSWMV
jgi:Putative transposase, YhgA-like